MSTTTLVVHAGGIRRTREDLKALHTPAATPTWKPVPHAELVGHLIDGLHAQGVLVTRDTYCTMGRDDARLFGALDLEIPGLDTGEFRMGLGLRGANDKSMAIEVIAAARVFVCDNWAFSGSEGAVCLRKKHTSRLDLTEVVPPAVEQFMERAGAFRLDLDRMRDFHLTDGRAKEVVFDAFAGTAPILPVRLFPEVSRLYFDDQEQRDKFPERSLWSLNNAFTEAVKGLKQAPQHRAGMRIGRYFGRLVRGRIKQAPVVIDGIDVWN